MAPAAALISSEVEAEEEEMVELPRFVPYPGMLVFPNLLLIPFWFFNVCRTAGSNLHCCRLPFVRTAAE
jgi:hypothetical protein